MALGQAELDATPFPSALCDDLFAAVLVDDEIDPEYRLPETISLDVRPEDMIRCFRLCRQLWYEGFDRSELIDLTRAASRDRDLDASARVRFKHIRAKFKLFRYAHALYGQAHRYPFVLDQVTITMGLLQDACRNGRDAAVGREAFKLRLLLSALPTRLLHTEADRLVPTSSAAFRRLLVSDFEALAALIAQQDVTGEHFHAARKRVGRQVSFWDTARTLDPTPDRYAMSRTLSAINGLMGAHHDRLVERRGTDPASYHERFRLPDDTRVRIQDLVESYRSSHPRQGRSSR